MAGPGTARKFYPNVQIEEPVRKTHLEVIEVKHVETAHHFFIWKDVFAVFRLALVGVLMAVGIVLIVTLSSYISVFHFARAESISDSASLSQVIQMKEYSRSINIFDISRSYYPVTVKVER